MKKLPDLKSKPIIGVPKNEWSKWTMKKQAAIDNLSTGASTPEAKEKIRKKRKSNAAIPITVYRIIDTVRDSCQIVDFKVEKVKDYPSVFEAGEELNISPADLRLILNPNYPGSISAKGYTVQRQGTEKGGYKDKLKKRILKQPTVAAYKDGKEVGRYVNKRKMCIELGLDNGGVSLVMNPKYPNKTHYKGYTFKELKQ